MTGIKWDRRFDTGIELIDTQHQRIVSMINELHSSTVAGENAAINNVLTQMRAYVEEHFSFEEELLWASDYEYTEAHIQLHQRFLLRLDNMWQRHQRGENISKELSGFLTKWLTHHIGHEDQDYVDDVKRIMNRIYI